MRQNYCGAQTFLALFIASPAGRRAPLLAFYAVRLYRSFMKVLKPAAQQLESLICLLEAACKRLASAGAKPSSRKRFAPGFVTWRILVSTFISLFFQLTTGVAGLAKRRSQVRRDRLNQMIEDFWIAGDDMTAF